ncbi:MAG: amino acid permease [Myxococcota bacterium]
MSERVGFKRNIGLFMAVMIGIGAMMGPGIFALPGELAKMVGPLGVLSYLALGLIVIPTALNYSELGASIPIAGGGYSFVSRLAPKTIAFLTGWFFWIGNALACAMYALIFALTVKEYFWSGATIPVVSIAVTVVFLLLNIRGAQQSLVVIAVMNVVELFILGAFAVLGAFEIEPANLDPVAPMGWGPFLPSMALIYVSFVGFDLITVAAEEIIAPGKTIPRAILITLFVGLFIYVTVVFVMMGTVHHTELGASEVPFIFAADRLFGAWGRWAGIVATVMASLSAFSVTLGASARILYALSRDGHFPRFLTKLHRTYQTPHYALLICAVVVVAFSSSGIVALVASVSAFGYLTGQGIVNASVVALHRKMPNLRRPFEAWWFPWLPIIGAVTCWVFVPTLEPAAFLLGGALTLVGGGIYLARPANRAIVRKAPEALWRLGSWLRRKRKTRMRVLIINGGRLGQNIADRLLAKDEHRMVFRSHEHQITFIEEDEAICKELEARYSVPIFHGDGTKKEILEQVGLSNVDVTICASDDDGRNVIAALQARRLGMQQVIAIVQEPEYSDLLEEKGIVAISAPWATAALVENYLDRPGVAELFEIEAGIANLVGVYVPEQAEVAGKIIQEIAIPKECVVAAVIRGKAFVVPRGHTNIEVGDHVIFVGPASAIKDAQEMFLVTK